MLCIRRQISLLQFEDGSVTRKRIKAMPLAVKRMKKRQIIAVKRLTMQTKLNYLKIDVLIGYRCALDIAQL